MSDQHRVTSRRAQKPRKNHRAIVLSAIGVVLVAGVGTLVTTGLLGHAAQGSAARPAGDGGATGSIAAGLPSGDAATAGASATASPSGSASLSASASPSASASRKGAASASASAPAGGQAAAAVNSVPAPAGGPVVFTGKAFDTCTAPSLAAMQAWHGASPYGAAAVYIGGQNRGCSQPNLTSSWVRGVHAAGWQLIPLYVGAQPPCQTSGNPERITAANAASLGSSDGADAVAHAAALGMGTGSAVYLDMEAYNASDSACSSAVLTYVQAWDAALHARGYWAGFYGFSML